MKLVTNMTSNDAKNFFMKGESYFTLNLPKYFKFDVLLKDVDSLICGKDFKNSIIKSNKNSPDKFEEVNYKILHNKDGKYAWRPFEMIHPFLYVKLVNDICEDVNWKFIKKRFKEYHLNTDVICCSIPGESENKNSDIKSSILRWWGEYEQKSISMSIKYSLMANTDITDCYPSIYTHSIAWALHTKEVSKSIKNDMNYIGNVIDKDIRMMSYGQTDGIPQGSILMDFIAEMILGYADELLVSDLKGKVGDYKVLRYRDDYRIFSNNSHDLDYILKTLTKVLSDLNLKLNSSKTFVTANIIEYSMKDDKVHRFRNSIDQSLNIQKQLFLIRDFSMKYPNSGSVSVLLKNLFYERVMKLEKRPNSYEQIISIVVDIMINNPRTYSVCVGILGYIFNFLKVPKTRKILSDINQKLDSVPNTTYLDIWLQRLTITIDKNWSYSSKLCKKIYSRNEIWNSDWLKDNIKKKFDESKILDEKEISTCVLCLKPEEVDRFDVYDN